MMQSTPSSYLDGNEYDRPKGRPLILTEPVHGRSLVQGSWMFRLIRLQAMPQTKQELLTLRS